MLALIIGITPSSASAFSDSNDSYSPLIITEILPGTKDSGSQEFIELYNQSATAINMATQKWELQIATSKATTWDKPKTILLTGTVQPGGYILLTSNHIMPNEEHAYLHEYSWAKFAPGLTSSSGHMRLVSRVTEVAVRDVMEWSIKDEAGVVTSPGISNEPTLLSEGLAAGSSLKRMTEDAFFTEVFRSSPCPSPTSYNEAPQGPVGSAPLRTNVDIENPLCEVEESEEEGPATVPPSSQPPATLLPTVASSTTTSVVPVNNRGLFSPRITELLPNPGSPSTDAEDEFIELYNENATSFDLSGYQLLLGDTGGKKYTFPKGTVLKPKAFTAFFSENTRASLSNAGGKVVLMDPKGVVLTSTDSYVTARDNQAWAFAQNKWQWTTNPTPNSANVIAVPAVKQAKATAANAKVASATSNKQKTQPANAATITNESPPDSPIHPMALAAVGVFAVLYGAYEYRHDLANKIYQYRNYRRYRRETRPGVEGR